MASRELQKLLRYERDVSNLGPETANIFFALSDWIDEMPRAWCGNWTNRECHAGGRFGEKCKGHNCGSYMMQVYDEDENGKAKWDEWFANDPDCDLVQILMDVETQEVTYRRRKKWW